MGKKVAIGTFVGFVVFFLAGWLLYGFLMKDTMANMAAAGTCMNPEPSMLHIILATLVQSLLLAAVLYKFGTSTATGGAIAAGWVTLLIAVWYDIWFLSSMPWYTTNMAVMDVLMSAVIGVIAGAVIGFVYGKVK